MKSFWKSRRFQVALIVVVVTAASLLLYLQEAPFLEQIEMKAYDLRFKFRGPKPPGEEVVQVVIDEKSLDELGRWPWPRSTIAELVSILAEGGARVIGFDIVFAEPEENSFLRNVQSLAEDLQGMGVDNPQVSSYLEDRIAEEDNDTKLAQSLADSGVAVLGYFFHTSSLGLEQLTKEQMQQYLATVEFSNYQTVEYSSDVATQVHFQAGYAVEANTELLSSGALDFGYFNFIPDADGTVRRVPLLFEYRGDELFPGANLFPPISLKMLQVYQGDADLSASIDEIGLRYVRLADQKIPTDADGFMLINYRGPERTFPQYSITDILNGRVAPETFRDKIVFIGATAVGIYDVRVTPFQPNMPGMEIHANVMDNILRGDFLQMAEWVFPIDPNLLIIVLAGVVVGLLVARVKAAAGVGVMLAAMVIHLGFNKYAFDQKGLVFNVVYPSLAVVGTYISLTIFRFVTEEKEKRFIKGAFSQYLAPSVVEQLVNDPSMLKLGGERRVCTAYFSDVAGFSSISEKMDPEGLVAFLNIYLTEMTEFIYKYEGTVDKFEGDAIIAFYGAPLPYEDHARRACWATLDMQSRLKQLRVEWKEQGKSELFMRVGLNTGPMVIGNMGSANRMDYTMMGDSVNLAARLEGVNKQYGTHTCMSEYTYQAAKDFVEARELDLIRVVGKKEPVAIYELMAKKGEPADGVIDLISRFDQGLASYRAQKWDEAISMFAEILREHPDDGPAKTFQSRCQSYLVNPPPPDWDGVYQMVTK